MLLGVVLVGAVQHLGLGVAVKRLVDVFAALDIELDVHVRLLARGLVLDVDALDKVVGVALKQVVNGALHTSPLVCVD